MVGYWRGGVRLPPTPSASRAASLAGCSWGSANSLELRRGEWRDRVTDRLIAEERGILFKTTLLGIPGNVGKEFNNLVAV